MTNLHRSLVLSVVVTATSACGSSATAPGGGSTTTDYAGLMFPFSGSFTAQVTSTASAEVVAGPREPAAARPATNVLGPESGTPKTIGMNLTFLGNSSVFAISGDFTGTTFTASGQVTEGNVSGTLSCTGTLIDDLLSGSCSFSIGVQSSFSFVGRLVPAGTSPSLALYCGLETLPSSNTLAASVVLGIGGGTSIIGRTAYSDLSQTAYLDRTVTSGAIADTAIGSGPANVFVGSYTSTTASGNDVGSGGVIGNWSSASPCQEYTPVVTPSGPVRFTASVNATPPSQVLTVSPSAVGPLFVVVTPAASWLTVTTAGNTLTLSVAPQANAGTLEATVTVYPQFTVINPVITVTYTVTAGAGG